MFEFLCECLDAVLNPSEYHDIPEEVAWTGSWDEEITTKAQGMLTSLTSSHTIIAFIITKNALENVRPVASKLQKNGNVWSAASKLQKNENVRHMASKLQKSGNVRPVASKFQKKENVRPVAYKLQKRENVRPVAYKLQKNENVRPVAYTLQKRENVRPVASKIQKRMNVRPVAYKLQKRENVRPVAYKLQKRENVRPVASKIQKRENVRPVAYKLQKRENVRPMASKIQKRDLDIYPTYSTIDQTRKRMITMRQEIEEGHNVWYKDVTRLVTLLGTSISAPRTPRSSRQMQRANAPSTSPQEHYLHNLVIPFCDHRSAEFHNRINPESRKGIEILAPLPGIIKETGNVQLVVDGLFSGSRTCQTSLRCELS